MAYIYGQRYQSMLFPARIEDYLPEDDPVRIYDAFVNALDLKELGIDVDHYKGGADEYDPVTMLKIIIYGYAQRNRSSRKLELACHRDIAYVWLTGNLAPDYRTIARFRKDNAKAIARILRKVVRLCLKWDLVQGNGLFLDSTAMEADASIRRTFTPESAKKRLKKIDARIEELLKETAFIDEKEDHLGSLAKINKDLLNLEKIKAGVKAVEAELAEQSLAELNTTDRDCVKVKTSGRCRAGYKAQSVVDDKHGLIVSTDVVASSSDMHQLSRQLEKAVDVLGKAPETIACDSGYASVDDTAKVDKNVTVIMPSQQLVNKERKANKEPETKDQFTKDKFTYDAANDTYTCPAGKILPLRFESTGTKGRELKNYRPDAGVCKSCPHFRLCTNNAQGRKITRHKFEHIREHIDAVYQSPAGQAIYAKRKIRCELPHAQIKHNLGARRFFLRGIDGTNAEFSLLAVAHNMTRIITILGATELMAKLCS
jgi:transposase